MADYKKMYLVLFHETTKAITALQNAQQTTEEMYIVDEGNENLNDENSSDKADEENRPPQS